MKTITLTRHSYHPAATIGKMRIENSREDSYFLFHTIERPWLDNKPFESCIPEGEYIVEPYSSEKYPDVYEIKDVPGRTKILIHVANYAKDVQGCIGLGLSLPDNQLMVGKSRDAMRKFKRLMGKNVFKLKIEQYKP